MAYKTSYDLNKDAKFANSEEQLYQPKKFRWCKCILISLLCGFVLLLILVNFDFKAEAHKTTNSQPDNAKLRAATKDPITGQSRVSVVATSTCNCHSSLVHCSFDCNGGLITNFKQQLEELYQCCNKDLNLTLKNCVPLENTIAALTNISTSTMTTTENKINTLQTNPSAYPYTEEFSKNENSSNSESDESTEATTILTRPPRGKLPNFIECHIKGTQQPYEHLLPKEKCKFSITPLSATSIEIVTNNLSSFEAIIYFSSISNYNLFTNITTRNQKYSAQIAKLNASDTYVFCCIQQFKPCGNTRNTKECANTGNWKTNISPFDCRSYRQPQAVSKPWLEVEVKIWIISLVVAGTCLMLFLGFLIFVAIVRIKIHNRNKTIARNLDCESMYFEPIIWRTRTHRASNLNTYAK